jgi:hypothetical protein
LELAEAESTTRRVQMELSKSSFERLSRLKELVEASSYAEVMKDALRLYEYVVVSDNEGAKFMVKDKDGQLSEIKIF